MKLIDPTGWSRADFIRFYTEVWHTPVIPILPNKKAAVKWSDFQNRMPTKEELNHWFVEQSPWGLAIICGAIANNIFSIDIDDPDLFKQLKQMGAFPTGSCIYKSARGFHVIMRATDMIPFPVKEHNPQLMNVDVLFGEFGISGDRTLSIMPDTPKREWIILFDEPVGIEYEVWLKKYPQYTRDMEKAKGEEITMWCPYHADKREGDPTATPSLFINVSKGVYQCFGCKQKGTVEQLIRDSKRMGFDLPELKISLTKSLLPILRLSDDIKEAETQFIIDQLLEAGENGTMLVSGVSGIGKTTLALSIAIPLSMGLPVLGELAVAKAFKVLFVNFEQSGQAVLKQAQIMTRYLGQPNNTEMFGIIPGLGIKIMGDDKRRSPRAQEIINRILGEGIEVIIMDSILALMNDPNEQEEVELVLELQQDIRDAGCAIIWLNHTVTGEGGGSGAERSVGRLGKALARFCATKMIYMGLEGENYIGRLSGTTRGWGKFDQPIVYENISHTAEIIDWEKIEKEDREGLGRTPLVKDLEQAILFARKLGKSKLQCAEEIGVARSNLYMWLSGEQYPDEASIDKIKKWKETLLGTASGIGQDTPGHSRKEPVAAQDKPTPVQKPKKAIPAPSPESTHPGGDVIKTLITDS